MVLPAQLEKVGNMYDWNDPGSKQGLLSTLSCSPYCVSNLFSACEKQLSILFPTCLVFKSRRLLFYFLIT